MKRQGPPIRLIKGWPECDVCPQPAEWIGLPTKSRELSLLCDYDATCHGSWWPEKKRPLEQADLPNLGDLARR